LVEDVSGECVVRLNDIEEFITFCGELHPRQTLELQQELLFEIGSIARGKPTGDGMNCGCDNGAVGAVGLITINGEFW